MCAPDANTEGFTQSGGLAWHGVHPSGCLGHLQGEANLLHFAGACGLSGGPSHLRNLEVTLRMLHVFCELKVVT